MSADRSRSYWEGLRAGPGGRSAAAERNIKRIAGCRRKLDICDGKASGTKNLGFEITGPLEEVGPQVMLSDSSVSTSEQTPRSALMKNSLGHVVDPGEGVPLQTAFAVSVVAKTATVSDALSTTLLLMGPERGEHLIKQLPETAAIWISSDGRSKSVSGGPPILFPARVQSLTRAKAQP